MKRYRQTNFGTNEKILQCPFTWNISQELINNFDISELEDEKNLYVPFLKLMQTVMKAFIMTHKHKFADAKSDLSAALNIWSTLEKGFLEGEAVAINVVEHVLQSTEYHILKFINDPDDSGRMQVLYDSIVDARKFERPHERGTVNGCQSIAWSTFFEPGMEEAIHYARLATLWSKVCPTWHFLLGKNLRRQRRSEKVLMPIEEECLAFTKAYELSANPHFGIYLAQMYRESKQIIMSRQIYIEIYYSRPHCSTIQLRLALGFIRMKDFDRAKDCLDFARRIVPESSMFLHYMGTYYQKLEDYPTAAEYFLKAVKIGTFASNLQYVECMLRSDPNFDIMAYLLQLLEKPMDITSKQTVLIHIGLTYYYQLGNLLWALKYFAEAINLDPPNRQLNSVYDIINGRKCNIIDLVLKQLLPIFKYSRIYTFIFTPRDAKNLEELCKQIMNKKKYNKYVQDIQSDRIKKPYKKYHE